LSGFILQILLKVILKITKRQNASEEAKRLRMSENTMPLLGNLHNLYLMQTLLSPQRIRRGGHNILITFFILFIIFFISTASYAEPPKRIVSLAPSTTEILFELGLGDRIVGVTNFCDYPYEAKKKQKIGGMSNPSLEAVISLKPDVVVVATDGNPKEFEERLRSLKINTYVFKARRISELPQAVKDMGTALGVKKSADEFAKRIETSLEKYGSKKQLQKKNVLFIVWPEPLMVAGKGTAVDDAINLLGSKNIASGVNMPYPKYSIEEIIRKSPDVIIIGKGHSDMKEISSTLINRLKNIAAVKNNKVCYVSDSLYRLGPRIIKGIEELAECLK
jgi:iron complex transport system substrate-binding protein